MRTSTFDPAEYLDGDVALGAYMDEALATNDPAFIADALGVLARAQGFGDVATRAGVSAEGLGRELETPSALGLATVLRVVRALGLRLSAQPVDMANPSGIADPRRPAVR